MMKIVVFFVIMRSYDIVGLKYMEYIGFFWGYVSCWYLGIFFDDEYCNKRYFGKEFFYKNI